MRVIVNADDLGYDAARDAGIIAAFRAGAVTSASVMANGVSAESAVALAKSVGLPLGLHLNLTEGVPLCRLDVVPSLVVRGEVTEVADVDIGASGDSSGGEGPGLRARPWLMRGKAGFRKAVDEGEVALDEVRMEMRAQLDWFYRVVGYAPVHVDGHQHVHVFPGVCRVFALECRRPGPCQVRATRLPLEDVSTFEWLPHSRRSFYSGIVEQCKEAAAVFDAAGLRYPSAFVGYGTMGDDMSVARLRACIQAGVEAAAVAAAAAAASGAVDATNAVGDAGDAGAGLGAGAGSASKADFGAAGGGVPCVEVMTHPGYPAAADGGGGCGEGAPDEFAQSPAREHELRCLCDARLLAWLAAEHTLCSYQEWLDA